MSLFWNENDSTATTRSHAREPNVPMGSPILREQTNKGENVLLLDDEDRTDWLIDFHTPPWFMTLYTEVVRAEPSKKIVYKVNLSKDCTVLDLLVGFEKYLSMKNSKLYHNDICFLREKMLSELDDYSKVLLIEDGAIRDTQPLKVVEKNLQDHDIEVNKE